MRLPRPHIPLSTRIAVAQRQNLYAYKMNLIAMCSVYFSDNPKRHLQQLLYGLFGKDKCHLDHDPPLAVRKKIHNRHGEIIEYDPPANSPDHLIYRKADDHRIKTNIRGEGAQYPDRVLIKKIRRIEHPKPKRKYNWPKRKVRP
jgi:hypothetical protein